MASTTVTTPTDNHIARAFFFTGVALDIETYDANRKDSGLALQFGGVYTILNTGSRTLKPGMLACWNPPPHGAWPARRSAHEPAAR
jgi:hypothetical protein